MTGAKARATTKNIATVSCGRVTIADYPYAVQMARQRATQSKIPSAIAAGWAALQPQAMTPLPRYMIDAVRSAQMTDIIEWVFKSFFYFYAIMTVIGFILVLYKEGL